MRLFLWVIAAFVYDLLLLAALSLLLAGLFLLAFGEGYHAREPVRTLFQLSWLGMVCGYYAFSWARGGQTLGMRAWKLQLVRDDGQPLDDKAIALRLLAGMGNTLLMGAGWLGYLARQRHSLMDWASDSRIQRITPDSADRSR